MEEKSSIRSMFNNVIPSKKRDVKIEDDNVLANMLSELESNDNENSSAVQNSDNKSSVKATEKAEMKNFMADFAQSARKPEQKAESTNDDVSFTARIHIKIPLKCFDQFFSHNYSFYFKLE